MSVSNFMENKFPGLQLGPPLFYSWEAAIRFELGVNDGPLGIHENPRYLPDVYRRAIDLFEALHEPEDVVYVVVDVPDFQRAGMSRLKVQVFSNYIKDRSLLFRLQHKTHIDEDEDGIYRADRFSLKCRCSDIRYVALLKAICNQDMGMRPSVHYAVYFLNETKGTIYHAYDDRGCDVLGTDVETIRPLYETFNEWILEYDRYAIETIFS